MALRGALIPSMTFFIRPYSHKMLTESGQTLENLVPTKRLWTLLYIFSSIHQEAGSNHRKAKKTNARQNETQKHGAKGTESATN